MKKPQLLVLIFVIVFQSCIDWEPFDGRQLDPKYFSIFNESLNQIVFDHFAISGSGYFSDSKKNRFLYKSDLVDTACNRHMVLVHEWDGSVILSSHIDTNYTTNESVDENYKIVWTIDNGGVIQGAQRFNSKLKLIATEDYVFEVNPVAYDPAYSENWPGRVCWIKEKTRFDGRGLLLEKKIYTYNEDGTVDIKTITPSKRE